MLCDGTRDCPHGEYEGDCKHDCKGLLMCRSTTLANNRKICIHQSNVCDGIINCLENGDDEMYCEKTACPSSCICHCMCE